MDCPSEENLIRLKLSDNNNVKHLDFDIERRELTIYHNRGALQAIANDLNTLNLGEKVINSEVTELDVELDNEDKKQAKLLWIILGINFVFFIIEMTTGLLSNSMGLIADSLDMLADTFVYGLSLLAVGKTVIRKKKIAQLAGYFQILLAIIGLVEVLRRFFGLERIPDFKTMILISILALIANSICLFLLQRSKSKEAHMQASMIFTSNDVIINLGVIIAGVLVLWLDSNIPDLIIGMLVFAVVIQGAVRILKLSK